MPLRKKQTARKYPGAAPCAVFPGSTPKVAGVSPPRPGSTKALLGRRRWSKKNTVNSDGPVTETQWTRLRRYFLGYLEDRRTSLGPSSPPPTTPHANCHPFYGQIDIIPRRLRHSKPEPSCHRLSHVPCRRSWRTHGRAYRPLGCNGFFFAPRSYRCHILAIKSGHNSGRAIKVETSVWIPTNVVCGRTTLQKHPTCARIIATARLDPSAKVPSPPRVPRHFLVCAATSTEDKLFFKQTLIFFFFLQPTFQGRGYINTVGIPVPDTPDLLMKLSLVLL